jgi:hypothetical protein
MPVAWPRVGPVCAEAQQRTYVTIQTGLPMLIAYVRIAAHETGTRDRSRTVGRERRVEAGGREQVDCYLSPTSLKSTVLLLLDEDTNIRRS